MCSHCPGTSTRRPQLCAATAQAPPHTIKRNRRQPSRAQARCAGHCRQPPHRQSTADSRRICRAPQTAAASAGHRRQPLHLQGTADSRCISRAPQTAAASAGHCRQPPHQLVHAARGPLSLISTCTSCQMLRSHQLGHACTAICSLPAHACCAGYCSLVGCRADRLRDPFMACTLLHVCVWRWFLGLLCGG